MIREATTEDVSDLVSLVSRFHAAGAYPPAVHLSPIQVGQTLTRLIIQDDGLVLLSTDGSVATGLLVLIRFVHPLSGEVTVSECVFFVDPAARGTGLRLLRAGEAWAQAHGAAVIQLVSPEGAERVERFYAAVHYCPVERGWLRRL
jgi:GNAT superfamily N-acetyltransferase